MGCADNGALKPPAWAGGPTTKGHLCSINLIANNPINRTHRQTFRNLDTNLSCPLEKHWETLKSGSHGKVAVLKDYIIVNSVCTAGQQKATQVNTAIKLVNSNSPLRIH